MARRRAVSCPSRGSMVQRGLVRVERASTTDQGEGSVGGSSRRQEVGARTQPSGDTARGLLGKKDRCHLSWERGLEGENTEKPQER